VKDGFIQLAPELDDLDRGFPLESYEVLQKLEEGHFWFTSRNRLISWLIERFAARSSRALEVGCGTGYVLYALRGATHRAQLAGSELHTTGLVYARRRHNGSVELFQMDAQRSGLVDALDLIGIFDVLEHIEDDHRVLVELYRMLAPNGVLIASVPQHPWLWSASDEQAYHHRRYAIGELDRKARSVGFEVVYRTSFAAFSLPLMAIDRWRTRKSGTTSAAVPNSINLVLKFIFWLEHAARRMHLPLPFGGSAVIVAIKRP
jgi:SAM-dependent methyltransferase